MLRSRTAQSHQFERESDFDRKEFSRREKGPTAEGKLFPINSKKMTEPEPILALTHPAAHSNALQVPHSRKINTAHALWRPKPTAHHQPPQTSPSPGQATPCQLTA